MISRTSSPNSLPLPSTAGRRAAAAALRCCEELGLCSETPSHLFRPCLSPSMARAHDVLRAWMREVGMRVEVDAIGNLRGHKAFAEAGRPRLVIGSHLDTIRNAGKYDGPLGVVLGIAAVSMAVDAELALPFDIEVIAFSDEEGVRFGRPFLGSLAVVGELTPDALQLTDEAGIRLEQAMRRFAGYATNSPNLSDAALKPEEVLGFLEVHIEQGPVLEAMDLPIAAVTSIAGQHWETVHFGGRASHAGTTPMHLRRDAVAAAAELALALERLAQEQPNLVATVGAIRARPGGNNVVAGDAAAEVDVRSDKPEVFARAIEELSRLVDDIARRRGLSVRRELHFEEGPVQMDTTMHRLMCEAIADGGHALHRMPSGAGHDARILAPHVPTSMLFVRSPEGLSHHPDEAVQFDDVALALDTMTAFLERLAAHAQEPVVSAPSPVRLPPSTQPSYKRARGF